MKQLILGGARAGKSTLAEHLAASSGERVVYVATATAVDEEMRARIRHHRQRRPSGWSTVEEPIHLARVIEKLSAPGQCVLVDCLTLWLSNLLLLPEEKWRQELDSLLESVTQSRGSLILVSNEIGMGIVPMGEVVRRFRDQAGWLHQALAARCDRVVLTVAGLPQVLKGEPL